MSQCPVRHQKGPFLAHASQDRFTPRTRHLTALKATNRQSRR